MQRPNDSPSDRPRSSARDRTVRPATPTDRPVFRRYNGSIEQNRSPDDREIRSPNRRRRIAIDDPDQPRASSPPVSRGSAPSTGSDRSRGSRSHGHHANRHRHHYGCGHYGYGHYDYGPYGYGPYGYGYKRYRSYPPYSGYDSPYYYPPYYRGHHFYGDFGDRDRGRSDVVIEGASGAPRQEGAMGALDLDLEPQAAEVFVDGYLVGEADQFDGYPNYLWLEEGTHELAFYREGYQTIFRQYTIYPGVIIDVDDHLREGDSIRPDGQVAGGPLDQRTIQGFEPTDRGDVPGQWRPDDSAIGRLVVFGSPGDAAIYLDGHFVGTAAEISELAEGLIVEPGDHVVELVRPGYETERVSTSVAAGAPVELSVSLKER